MFSLTLAVRAGFVEKQIRELGGKTIQEECKEEKKKGTFTYGEVCKTSAGQLQCRKIYHIALYEQWISTCKLSLEVRVQKTNSLNLIYLTISHNMSMR